MLTHPGVKSGPWADDMEATVAVVCAPGATCAIILDRVNMHDNTGVATSALYTLCDGAASCTLELKDCTIADNRLLWQPATDPARLPKASYTPTFNADGAPVFATGTPSIGVLPVTGYMDLGFIQIPVGGDGEGMTLLKAMVPWQTYTYPLVDQLKKPALVTNYVQQGADISYVESQIPTVTGRTMGAVVLHQRNSPAVGAAAGVAAMMSVTVTGGTLTGNDGSAIMSTATDWQELAGGNGTWDAGNAPRHSADLTITGLEVHDHNSGWPALWLRWPRKVEVRDSQVTRSTGAVWLDEVRDFALIDNCTFKGNSLTQLWLDSWGWNTPAPDEGFIPGRNLGAGMSHVVKIGMTPLGTVTNTATVSNSVFEDNPTYITGVLFVKASDVDLADENTAKFNQPGRTEVNVVGSTFRGNTCRRLADGTSPICLTGERPVYIAYAYSATVDNSTFAGNNAGGLYVDSTSLALVQNSVFEDNTLTYQMQPQTGFDNSQGGAAIIVSVNSDTQIRTSRFRNNNASVSGGALYLRQMSTSTISGSTFDHNTAMQGDGGAVQLDSIADSAYITSSSFSSNTAGRSGGAISAFSVSVSTGWSLERCNFTNNTAMLNPGVLSSSSNLVDRFGGGAIFCHSAPLYSGASKYHGNRVLMGPGGAIRIVDSNTLVMRENTLTGNVAIMGGAIAMSRLGGYSLLRSLHMRDNSVVDPWAWSVYDKDRGVRSGVFDMGYGGAIYVTGGYLMLNDNVTISNNHAKFGGAVAVVGSTAIELLDGSGAAPWNAAVSDDIIAAAGVNTTLFNSTLPAWLLFENNTAQIGGAFYIADTGSTSLQGTRFGPSPRVVFNNNTANAGGAVYLEGVRAVSITGVRFLSNSAKAVTMFQLDNSTGLSSGAELDAGPAMGQPGYGGGGGALCVVGQAGVTVQLQASQALGNTAKDGGAIFIADALDCIDQAGCHKVQLSNVDMHINKATGRGGAVFWGHENTFSIASCPSDRAMNVSLADPALAELTSRVLATTGIDVQAHLQGLNVSTIAVKAYRRKPPSPVYRYLTTANRDQLLSSIGGFFNASRAALYLKEGRLASSAADLASQWTALRATLEAAMNTSGVAPLTPDGWRMVLSPSSPDLATLEALDSEGVSASVLLNDTAWLGMPYFTLPCASWNGNVAGTGDDVATTPYFVQIPERIDFYTSNTDINIDVTVHDWYGNNCTGDNATQPLVLVRVDSAEVSGQLEVRARNGTSTFSALRLRGREGLHNVSMAAFCYDPARDLLTDQLQIYVRPCGINEFLAPKNLDECIPCDYETYNFNVSAVTCNACPEDAACRYPGEPSRANPDAPIGYLVPDDGFWHSSFYSEQIHECPNSASCTYDNRSDAIAALQQQIFNIGKKIQRDAALVVADVAAARFADSLVGMAMSGRLRRRLQQVKAQPDDLYNQLLINATIDMMPQYMDALCADGYTGTLCGECRLGWGWTQVATCIKCPSKSINDLYYALVTLLTLAVLAFTVYASLKEQGSSAGKLVGGLGPRSTASPVAPISPNGMHYTAPTGALPPTGNGPSALPPQLNNPSPLPTQGSPVQHNAGTTVTGIPTNTVAVLLDGPNNAAPYEYVDPMLAAARGTFSSQPGTPMSAPTSPMVPAPPAATLQSPSIPGEAPQLRAGSVTGVPAHANGNGVMAGPVGEAREMDSCEIEGYTSDPGPVAEGTTDPGQITNALYSAEPPRAGSFSHGPATSPPKSPSAADVYMPSSSPQPIDLAKGSRTNQHDSYMKARVHAHQSTVLKIFVSYIQVLALLQNVPLEIPGVMDVYYRINNQATSYPGMLVSLDCSIPNGGSVSKAMIRVILAVLAPLYIFAGSLVYFVLWNLFEYHLLQPWLAKRKNKKGKRKGHLRLPSFKIHISEYMPRQVIVTFITTMFFFYPNVVQSLMTIFDCQEVDSSTPSNPLADGIGLDTDAVWSQDFGETCYQGSHLGLVLGLGLPGCILIAVGWPLVSALLVAGKLPTCLINIRFTEDMTEFFLADFKAKYVWWESLVMLRKLAIAIIVTFLDGPTSAGVQLLLVICVLVLAMAIHLTAMPYHHLYTNNLEIVSLVVLLTTLYLSLYFSLDGSISSTGRVAISVIILIINILMCCAFVFFIIQAYWTAALINSGLDSLDSIERQKMTPEELKQHIMQKKLKKRYGDIILGQGQVGPNPGKSGEPLPRNASGAFRTRSSLNMQHRMASIYATAVVTGLRVGSTTTKVLNRMKTMLDPQPPSRLASRENSIDENDPEAPRRPLRGINTGKLSSTRLPVEEPRPVHVKDSGSARESPAQTPLAGTTPMGSFTAGKPRTRPVTTAAPLSADAIGSSPATPMSASSAASDSEGNHAGPHVRPQSRLAPNRNVQPQSATGHV
ncbi:hypothetical protein HYH03_008769 [Edaphochlamys debaryana]|uniref:Right handed beta helix domain-containing protein n=1 Tax=Edaphochlamys debaryana TaxID=47281 RepID=A0A836BXT6_9CHLO|nr:hypothetical protein HYH03_008769 [Edaphochlamys debaryana]|eukprot:KAG2493106.1 hypothetical protein HYH03_008769 [Edaphochlamys debaryana]